MKRLPIALWFALMSLASLAFGESTAQKPFDTLKSLAGTWQGPITLSPAVAQTEGNAPNLTNVTVTLRVTSMGNTLMHEMRTDGRPDDPISMFYLDGDHLSMTHFCDAGNQPHFVGKVSPDGKRVEFDYVDATGNMAYGHMQHAVITVIDANHHTEDWTFMEHGKNGDSMFTGHFDLQRTK
jgi:hypothetical protein